jgi:hypothetical protein
MKLALNAGNLMNHDATGAYLASSGAFRNYVRGVFADGAAHANALRARRARWLYSLSQRSLARWEGEGGSRKR